MAYDTQTVKRLAKLVAPPSQTVEATIFHYTTPSGLIGIIESKSLFATALHCLNDREELNYGIGIVRDRVSNLQLDLPQQIRSALMEFDDSLTLWERRDFYATCFSAEGDDLTQWRGYAHEGGGYCVGFCGRKLAEWADQLGARLIKVDYEPTFQHARVDEALRYVISRLEDDCREFPDPGQFWPIAASAQIARVLLPIVLSFKNPAFKAEAEYRLVFVRGIGGPSDEMPLRFRPGRGFVIPYMASPIVDGSGLLEAAFESVRCGPNTDPENAATCVRALLDEYGWDARSVTSSAVPYRG